MTMGPEPTTIAVLTSSRLGIGPTPAARRLGPLELRHEISEDVLVVPGPRPRLGMVLHGEDREFPVGHALHGAVVQIQMRHLELGTWEGAGIDREAVVLRCDMDASRAKVFDGLVPAAVPKFQLERPSPEGEGQELVAEADPEDRRAAGEFPRTLHRRRKDFPMGRIARTVGEDHAVRFESEDVVRRPVVPHSADLRLSMGLADNAPLDLAIPADD